MKKNLLLEIGTEELPSSSIEEGISALKNNLEKNLKEFRIEFDAVSTFATPRRIVSFIEGIEDLQKDLEKIITGPPKKIIYDSSGKPAEAAKGFAKNLGVDFKDLFEYDNGKGIYLAYKTVEKGKKTKDILPEILKESITSMSFAKMMTWGDYLIKFSRPIRWLSALYGSDVINFQIENISSSDKTYGNRCILSRELKIPKISNLKDYTDFLETKAYVILESSRRQEMITDALKVLEKNLWNSKRRVILDSDLLSEVVNLVEYPNVLVGSFPEEYLFIPKEILVEAIQHHQRYFAVVQEDTGEKITTSFITVQNGLEDSTGEIIKGNERVLKARLSDAKFFYEEDKKYSFEDLLDKLRGVVFYSGVGTMRDKASRLEKISEEIRKYLPVDERNAFSDNAIRASRICKCDLVTNLVVEFPELQGLVGREYARERGEPADVCEAIFEHYLPRYSGDGLPKTDAGAVVSIADKIDSISSMFLAGNIPTGSQDPFALRRKAGGIILTCIEREMDIDILNLSGYSVQILCNDFPVLEKEPLIGSESKKTMAAGKNISYDIADFITGRYRFMLERDGKRTDLFDAIKAAGDFKVLGVDKKYKTLLSFAENNNILQMLSEPMTRCKNIIKGKEIIPVDSSLFIENEEKKLFEIMLLKENAVTELLKRFRYEEALAELAGFAGSINIFFDRVLVMDKDVKVRDNRIGLIHRCSALYMLFADFSKIIIA